MPKQEKPLYVTLPYFKGEWTVTFQPHPPVTNSFRRGYGELPAEYAHLPTVVFTGNDLVTTAMNYPIKDLPGYGGDLAAYLNYLVDLGVEVRNWKG